MTLLIPKGADVRSESDRERWLLVVEGSCVRELADAIRALPGRRAVRAEAWVVLDFVGAAA